MIIKIPGTPIAKKRPRFARIGKGVRTYSIQETEEGRTLLMIKDQVREQTDKPVKVSFFFKLPRPKNHFGSGKNAEQLKASAPKHHTSKPDIDNMVKFYMDCLNGIVWHDDRQVVIQEASKMYHDEPETVIIVNEL